MLYTDEDRWESDVARLYEPGCRTWVHYNNEDDGCFLSFRERRVGTKGVCLDSARLVGSAVLDHSKVRMWNFHYECMKKICRPLLLYQDTDSFVYLIPGSCPIRAHAARPRVVRLQER